MQDIQVVRGGIPAKEARKALVMIHGRYGSADEFITVANELTLESDFTLAAPQAPNFTWYPYSFMAREELNQPSLHQSLAIIHHTVNDLQDNGITADNIYFLGFSQGACLMLEYIARNARHYGGAAAFTGGLIGENLNYDRYTGNFNRTNILITAGVPDPHVPLSRVQESQSALIGMLANVDVETFSGKPHGIDVRDITLANKLIFGK